MSKKEFRFPEIKQTVRILTDQKEDAETRGYGVVDIVTLDGRIKLFSLDPLDRLELEIGKCLILEYGKEDALYRSSWRVDYFAENIDMGLDDHAALLLLSPDYSSLRIQRRRYFRLHVKLPVKFKSVVFPDDIEKNINLRKEMIRLWYLEAKNFPHQAESVDISEEGICLVSKAAIENKEQLALIIQLPEGAVALPGRVVWSTLTEAWGHLFYKAGIQFICDRLEERDKLRVFIVKEQRRQLHEKRMKKELENSNK